MNMPNNTRWTEKLVMVALTVVLGVGSLQWVASSMNAPAPEAVAARQQFLAAEDARAYEIRTLAAGEVRFATASGTPAP